MTCPRCGSDQLWDDNLWWGCDVCGYAVGPDGPTAFFMKKMPDLPNDVRDVKRDQPEHFIRLMRIEPDRVYDCSRPDCQCDACLIERGEAGPFNDVEDWQR